MDYLLYNKRSYITARALASQLGLKSTSSIERLQKLGKSPVIRYGNSDGMGLFKNDTNMNSSKVIRLCANSYHFSRWAKENGYLSPLYQRFDRNNLPEFPFLLRRLYHMRGKDIILIQSKADLNKLSVKQLDGRYWVPYYETTFELRVHVIREQIVRVFKKIKPGANDSGEFIRTSAKDWHYSLRSDLDDKYEKAQNICVSLMKDLGLFFGGIDIAWDNVNKQYIVWEVNTAPGLSQPTLEIYSGILRKLIYGN